MTVHVGRPPSSGELSRQRQSQIAFIDLVPCATSLNRRFGERTVSIIRKHIRNLNNTVDGDSTFSETSVRASATRYQVHEDVFYVTVFSARHYYAGEQVTAAVRVHISIHEVLASNLCCPESV
jgi:hypothetical protein